MVRKGKTINLSLPTGLLRRVDKVARKEYASRSEFVRTAITERLRKLENPGDWPQIPSGRQELEEFYETIRRKRAIMMYQAEKREERRAYQRDRAGEYPSAWCIGED